MDSKKGKKDARHISLKAKILIVALILIAVAVLFSLFRNNEIVSSYRLASMPETNATVPVTISSEVSKSGKLATLNLSNQALDRITNASQLSGISINNA